MASYCKQCSEEIFGEDCHDFRGLTTPQDVELGQAALVLCEGCGPIQVDPDGACESEDCEKAGHKWLNI